MRGMLKGQDAISLFYKKPSEKEVIDNLASEWLLFAGTSIFVWTSDKYLRLS